jgi:UDP-GlcNAc:undecaprenyl-phosphate/decaprenyl-phosphate GlcNAc-1-phosphate transferase
VSWLWIPIAFGAALVTAAVATPLASRLSFALGAIDRPNARKVSARTNIPRWGGLAVALGSFVGIGVALLMGPSDASFQKDLEALLVGALLVLGIGAMDDRWSLAAWPKLAVEIAAAAIAFAVGFRIEHITDPITGNVWYFAPWLSWLLTTTWIVVVTNSFNLIDGLDGLCTGVSAIIGTALTLLAWQSGNPAGLMIGVPLVGALLGFLPFNFPPARIFVGDTGALFIGYCLALLALENYQRATVVTFVVPLLALAVPLLDTLLSILRRLRRRSNVMVADREHIHHRLLKDFDGSHRPAVLSLYFLTACFCVIAISFTRLHGYAAIVFLVVVLLLTYRILKNLGLIAVPQPALPVDGNETR